VTDNSKYDTFAVIVLLQSSLLFHNAFIAILLLRYRDTTVKKLLDNATLPQYNKTIVSGQPC